MNILDKLKEKINKIKEIIKSKEGITLIGIIILLMVITLISVVVKDTHAYYSSVTNPVQIFNSKVGDFKPKITSFYIKQTTSPKYTNAGSNTVYITPGTNNKNIDQVCITETNNVSSCTWQNITSNKQYSYTFTNTKTDGNKTIFGFVKDKYGNKSVSSSDVITYDKTLPVINKFYIKNEDATKYTNLQANTVYFTYTETNPQDMCVTEGTDTKNCTWVTVGKSTSYTFTNTTEGTKTVRGYVRDKAGNISSVKTSSITYDKTLPVISKFYIKEDAATKYTNLQKNTVYFTYTETNPQDMCVTEGTDTKNCTWVTAGSSTDYTFTNTTEGSKTVRGYVRDKAGNISSVKTSSITYDKTAPTIKTIATSNLGETSVTLTVTANTDTSGIYQYCYSTSSSSTVAGTCQSSSSINLTGLKAGTKYTYYLYLKDKAGNSGITSKKSYSFTTTKPVKDTLTSADKNNTLQTTPFGGLYRYVGWYETVKYNYICFGTSDKTECLNNPDKYMYRIIGITDGSQMNKDLGLVEGQLKLIKATPSKNDQIWVNDRYTDIPWGSSDVYKYLNGTKDNTQFLYTIQHLTNGTYWDGLITSQKWYIQDQSGWPTGPEPTGKLSGAAKIGLMYASDYFNAGEYVWDYPYNDSTWLLLKHGWKTNGDSSYEWTMTRCGFDDYSGWLYAWWVHSDGQLIDHDVTWEVSVRPVFYLKSNVVLSGGGTSTDPFRILS